MLTVTQRITPIAGSVVGALASIVMGIIVNDWRWYPLAPGFLALAVNLWFLLMTKRGNANLLILLTMGFLIATLPLAAGLVTELTFGR